MKHCPDNRKNFLSYAYVLHKFCQLLELDDLLPYFPLLKSREKLQQQDQIWEKYVKVYIGSYTQYLIILHNLDYLIQPLQRERVSIYQVKQM